MKQKDYKMFSYKKARTILYKSIFLVATSIFWLGIILIEMEKMPYLTALYRIIYLFAVPVCMNYLP